MAEALTKLSVKKNIKNLIHKGNAIIFPGLVYCPKSVVKKVKNKKIYFDLYDYEYCLDIDKIYRDRKNYYAWTVGTRVRKVSRKKERHEKNNNKNIIIKNK